MRSSAAVRCQCARCQDGAQDRTQPRQPNANRHPGPAVQLQRVQHKVIRMAAICAVVCPDTKCGWPSAAWLSGARPQQKGPPPPWPSPPPPELSASPPSFAAESNTDWVQQKRLQGACKDSHRVSIMYTKQCGDCGNKKHLNGPQRKKKVRSTKARQSPPCGLTCLVSFFPLGPPFFALF